MLPLNPAKIPALYQKARADHAAGRLDAARKAYTQITLAKPALPEPHYQLGQIALRENKLPTALACFERARKLKPKEPSILDALASLHISMGNIDAANALYDELARLFPKAVKPLAEKARMLQNAGRFEAAERAFDKAFKLAPHDGELFRLLGVSKKVKKGDPFLARMEAAAKDPKVTGRSRMHLNFALAKAMEDSGQYERTFTYLRPANDAMAEAYPMKKGERKAEVDGLIAAFEGADYSRTIPGANSEIAPIFVTGLPRSGTTLVEQILASHPLVSGGGEMSIVRATTLDVLRRGNEFRPLSDLTDKEIKSVGDRYAAALRDKLDFDTHATDKSLQTHTVFGLLRLALPRARFIVVERDPRDTLYSIYKQIFEEGTHRYAYSMTDLVDYYRQHQRLIAFWKQALPDHIHTVHYEDLVSDPEPQSRALVAAAGLDWDDACLSFYENKRTVQTLSVHQVRQPVYKGSVGVWKRYEADLADMLNALKDS
ncbi:sulfotransferase [Alphaproteobacteria bacterium KMM 3653]|uniref:Sulfotransferase n=1 Tax=Harenicola maris TaxID=2841044 RepID=A0AAP2CQT4_9RHOB|nr:sulfotransferase [Harenicola maris]